MTTELVLGSGLIKTTARKILTEDSLERTLDAICEEACRLLGAERAMVVRVDENQGLRRVLSSHNFSRKMVKAIESIRSRSFTQDANETGEVTVFTDLENNSRIFDAERIRKMGIQAVCVIPITLEGNDAFGSIVLHHLSDVSYDPEAMQLAESIGDLAAIAIENARLHEEARESRNFFRSLMDDSGDPMMVTDMDHIILRWNAAAEKQYGYTKEEVLGKTPDFLIPADRQGDIIAREEARSHGLAYRMDTSRVRKDGSRVPVMVTVSPVVQENGQVVGYCSIHRDMTQIKQLEESLRERTERLEKLSRHDELTGLYNRRAMMESLYVEISRSRRYGFSLCVVMIDLDFFKEVNDRYGHVVGDEVLINAARKIRGGIRATDISARYGGEEFCLILPNSGKDQTFEFADRIRKRMSEEPCKSKEGHEIPMTMSAGVALFDPQGDDEASLVERADRALYQAKQEGRNRVCLAP